jgi:hypothetical protein
VRISEKGGFSFPCHSIKISQLLMLAWGGGPTRKQTFIQNNAVNFEGYRQQAQWVQVLSVHHFA